MDLGRSPGEMPPEQAVHPRLNGAGSARRTTVTAVIGLIIDLVFIFVRLMVWMAMLAVRLTIWFIQVLFAAFVAIIAMISRRV